MPFTEIITEQLIEEKEAESYTINENVASFKCLVFDPAGNDDELVIADNSDLTHKGKFFGVAKVSGTSGNKVMVQAFGEMENSGWSWGTMWGRLYYDSNGDITDVYPSGGDHVQIIGKVMSPTKIFLNPEAAMSL